MGVEEGKGALNQKNVRERYGYFREQAHLRSLAN